MSETVAEVPAISKSDAGKTKEESEQEGRDFETLVLGIADTGKARCGYVDFETSLRYAGSHQPEWWNPKIPPTELSKGLFERVSLNLPEFLRPYLRFYSSVDTALDWWHSTDCYFELVSSVALVGLTTERKRNGIKGRGKAHVIIRRGNFENAGLEEKARKIADILSAPHLLAKRIREAKGIP